MNKTTALKKYTISTNMADIKFKGNEYTWEPGAVTEANRKTEMLFGLNWLNYMCDHKDNRKFLEDWIRWFREDTAKADLAMLNKVPDKALNSSLCHLSRIAVQGFPLTDEEQTRIWEMITAGYAAEMAATKAAEELTPEKKMGVQERMDLQVDEIVGAISETAYALMKGTQKSANAGNITNSSKLSAIHFKKLGKALEPVMRELAEVKAALADKRTTDDGVLQLQEAYRWVTNRGLKAAIEFCDECLVSANRLSAEKKIAKVRKKKPVDKVKLVRKLKYMAKSDELKITSINPVNCLNVSELWVYNSKTRKLGVYRSEFPGGIMVKGTGFIGTLEKSSIQKTLRKPEKQLAEFMALGKNQLRKWFDAIKGVEHRMKPRINDQTLLLRVNT